MAHEMEKFTLIAPWSFKCIITHSLIIHCSMDHPPFFNSNESHKSQYARMLFLSSAGKRSNIAAQREITVTCCVFVDEKGVRNGLFTIPVDIYHGS